MRMRGRLRRPQLWTGAALCAALAAYFYWPAFAGQVVAARDVFRIFIPEGALVREALLRGEWPLWNPYARLGQPLWAMPQAQAAYPVHVVALLASSAVRAMTLQHLLHVFVALWGTYLACRALGARRMAAWLGAVAFAFGPLFTSFSTLPNVGGAAAWSGFILWSAERLGGKPNARWTAALAGFLCLSFLNGAPESLLWQVPLAAVAALRRGATRRRVLPFVGACAWALALSATSLVPALELTALSDRAAAQTDRLAWSTDLRTLLSVFVFQADRPRGEYEATQNLLDVVYLGASVAVFAAFAFVGRRRRFWLAFAAVAAFFAVLSLGNHFAPSRWVLAAPPFSLFRYPVKYLVALLFAGPVLAAVGSGRGVAWMRRRRWKPALAVAAAVAVLVIALSLGGFGLLRPTLAAGIGAAAIFAALAVLSLRRGAALLVVAAELLLAHAVWKGPEWFDPKPLQAPSTVAQRLRDEGASRIRVVERELHGGDDTARAYVERSRERLVPMRFAEEHVHAFDGDGAPVLARWVELERRIDDVEPALAVTHTLVLPDPEEGAAGRVRVRRNANSLPRAYVTHTAATSPDPLEQLASPEFLRTRPALFSEAQPPLPASSCSSTAELSSESLDVVTVAFDACSEGYLVLADMAYPGWKAAIDGQPAPLLRANAFMRAVRVPQGRHQVVFRFAPASVFAGSALSAVALAGLALAFLARRRV